MKARAMATDRRRDAGRRNRLPRPGRTWAARGHLLEGDAVAFFRGEGADDGTVTGQDDRGLQGLRNR